MIYKFSFPTLIHFGPGARHELAAYLKSQKAKRPLVVTDEGIAALPLFKELLGELRSGRLKAESFFGFSGNPVKTHVSAGVKAYRAHKADSIVGLGGGAALDVAKAIALMAKHPGDLFDYEDEKPGARPMNKEIPLWVGLPTTSGTGSEVGRSTVISDDKTHVKKIMFSPRLMARAVFADPELTLDLPAKVTAATGMDALTHCVESYLAKGYHPICDGIALEGLRLAGANLAKCVTRPHDIDARSAMMMSSMMGAIAFQKGLGLTHSCAHALSTAADLHHGLANGILIDHALKHNISAVPERFKVLAQTVGLPKMTTEAFFDWLKKLKKDIGIPERLSAVGIKKDLLPRLVDLAFADGCHQNNPRPCTKDDFARVYAEAL